MMMKRNVASFVLYMFGFLLLWEWLRPVQQLTDTDHIGTFIVFLLLAFMISYLNVNWFWQFLIKLLFILYSINRFHYQEGFFHLSWLKTFLLDAKHNVGWLVERNWNGLSNEFRTLLFFILLWLMVYLIHYWLLNRQRIFIFFFMTLVYIAVLDTFTVYNAKVAIVRTVIIGFAVMGMLTYYRMIQKENVDRDSTFLRKWMTPLAVMIAISVLIGITAPKAAPIWPDPVPYFTADHAKDGKSSGVHRIGYGTNDSALGGPFVGDNHSVFQVEANGKHYYKVETKDRYTGKGWIASGSTPIPFRQEDLVPVFSIPNTVEKIDETVSISVSKSYPFNHVVYPAGVRKITKILPQANGGDFFQIDTTKERIQFFDTQKQPVVPKAYSIDFAIPKYKAEDLLKTTTMDPAVINQEFYNRYTLLPEGLPARVKELAEQITAGKTNWFEKARAVESYFGNADFTYDQKNVAVPGENDDYVDQFLFETKRGYCDNYSTSMAVLLRTLGIPTRWVKGYTGGEFLKYSDEVSGRQVYEVTNNNAHSWVEVYFPNQGWVPFEPTKGFSNEIIINYEAKGGNSSSNPPATPSVQKPQTEQPEDAVKPKESQKNLESKSIWKSVAENHWRLLIFLLLLLVGVGALIYRIRGKWVPYCVLTMYRFKKKDENIGTAYLILLNQLERYGLKRKENQTLRHYARYIDTFFSTREMTRLTVYYEQYMYHESLPKGTWKESHKLWENLIKKTIA